MEKSIFTLKRKEMTPEQAIFNLICAAGFCYLHLWVAIFIVVSFIVLDYFKL